MKLENFKKHNVRNKKIIYSIMGITIIIGMFILFKSFAFFESKYDFNMIKGRIPEFNGGDIQLAFTINGIKSDGVFPSKSSGYAAKSVTCQNGATASWNNITWSLENIEPNGNKKISCNIDFRTSFYKVVKIGDYVSYTPSKTSYTIPASMTGYSSDQKINPSELNLWRVIKKNEDGTVEMVSEYVSSTVLSLYGSGGHIYFYSILGTVAKQYETEEITVGSRYIGCGTDDSDLVSIAVGANGLKAQMVTQIGSNSFGNYFWCSRSYSGKGETCDGGGTRYAYYINSSGNMSVGSLGVVCQSYARMDAGLRIIIVVNDSVKVLGNGTKESPYKIN